MEERGHLFVIDGDLTKVACDAWLLPTDGVCSITTTWHGFVGTENLLEGASARGSRRLKPELWTRTDSALVSRYEGPSKVPVFLGHIGGRPPHEIAQAAVDFMELARPAALRAAALSHRRPLLALNHLGTGHGGQSATKGSALEMLIHTLDRELAGRFADIDVVLVAWGAVAESASQVIRRRLHEPIESDPHWQFHGPYHDRIIAKARTLVEAMEDSRVSIFMGAGVSAGAGLKGWDDLLEDIGLTTHPPTTREELRGMNDNRDAATLLEQRLRRSGDERNLESELRDRLTGDNRFSLQHGLLASLPCSEYITTNVDSLFELASEQAGSGRVKEIPNESVRAGDRWILKLHGSVDRKGSLVFTREHYIDSFKANRALVGLVQSMLLMRHMLFVGYGLRDEDFHELVHEVRAARSSSTDLDLMGTVLALFDDQARADLWQDSVDILPMRPRPAIPPGIPDEERERRFQSQFQTAVRDLERFLDLLGMLSVDTTKFVLDPTWNSQADSSLAAAAGPLIAALRERGQDDDDDTWRQLRQVLRGLGADV